MADRDADHLKHFASRATQSRSLGGGPTAPAPVNVNLNIHHDQHHFSMTDELDATRFRQYGTSVRIAPINQSCSRRLYMDSVGAYLG